MEILIKRRYKGDSYTIGTMYIDGERFCDTLEDKDRGLDSSMSEANIARYKVYGKTAIPTGTYRIDMSTFSQKFKNRSWAKHYGGIVPRLVGVKGFSGVLIHPGNTPEDTLGCILVGENKIKGQLINSQATFRVLYSMLKSAKKKGENIQIEIV